MTYGKTQRGKTIGVKLMNDLMHAANNGTYKQRCKAFDKAAEIGFYFECGKEATGKYTGIKPVTKDTPSHKLGYRYNK